jgi:hypothetical protein
MVKSETKCFFSLTTAITNDQPESCVITIRQFVLGSLPYINVALQKIERTEVRKPPFCFVP